MSKENLGFQVILGCGAAAFLVLLGLKEAGTYIYEPHYPEKAGFAPEVQLASAGGGEAAAGPQPIDFGALYADAAQYGDLVTRGERVAAACKACHTVAQGGETLQGPNLWNIVGRDVAGVTGFDYSEAMAAHEGAWTYDELSHFLLNPGGYIRGTKMTYAGVKKPEDRAALIAYLRSLSASPAPLPPPLPVAEPAAAEEGGAPAAPPAEPQKT